MHSKKTKDCAGGSFLRGSLLRLLSCISFKTIKSWLWPSSILSVHDVINLSCPPPICLDPNVHLQLLTSSTADSIGVCLSAKKEKFKKEKTKVFFYLPFGEMHCSDMNKEKVHLVCWIMCKLVITQSEYLYNCLYFFIMILERNVFIFLTSVPDVSSVGLTLWLVWWDSYLCIEPLLWWILCMQCLGNTVGNMGRSWY